MITVGQVVEEILAFTALYLHVKGNDRRKVIVLILPPLPVGDVRLYAQQPVFYLPHSFIRRDGDDVEREHHAGSDVAQLGDHVVPDIVGIIPQKHDTPVAVAYPETVLFQLKAVGGDVVPEVMPLSRHIRRIKVEGILFLGPEEVMDQLQPLRSVQRIATGAKPRKVCRQLAAYPVEIRPGVPDAVLSDAHRKIPQMLEVACVHGLIHKARVGFPAESVHIVPAHGHEY